MEGEVSRQPQLPAPSGSASAAESLLANGHTILRAACVQCLREVGSKPRHFCPLRKNSGVMYTPKLPTSFTRFTLLFYFSLCPNLLPTPSSHRWGSLTSILHPNCLLRNCLWSAWQVLGNWRIWLAKGGKRIFGALTNKPWPSPRYRDGWS